MFGVIGMLLAKTALAMNLFYMNEMTMHLKQAKRFVKPEISHPKLTKAMDVMLITGPDPLGFENFGSWRDHIPGITRYI